MQHLDFFFREHAGVHSKDAIPADFNMDWILDGLSDDQLRARPHGLNSIAWLLWHMARVEDSCISVTVCAEDPLIDDDWVARLRVDLRPGDGEGMSKEQVAELSTAIDLAELREYRNAVGRRTRELASGLWPDRWSEPFTTEHLAAAERLGVEAMPWLVGKPREMLLHWWAVQHTQYHLGQMSMVRGVLLRED